MSRERSIKRQICRHLGILSKKNRRRAKKSQPVYFAGAATCRPYLLASFQYTLVAAALLLPPPLMAGPVGEQVVSGTVGISRPDVLTTTINQQSAKAIVNWQDFSLAAPELVRFQQPDHASVILNRVVGGNPSEIMGRLQADGQVFIANPQGVLFGPNSQVNVHGLLATTHQIANDDFLAGNYTFQRPSEILNSEVINQGLLAAAEQGYIVLAGDYAANQGIIQARLGTVALAAGEQFTLDLHGDQLIGLAVNEATLAEKAGVENLGRIAADGGKVLMTARVAQELAATVVNNEGLVQARGISEENGEIILHGGTAGIVANRGTLDVSGSNSGETGGKVMMLGEKVGLFDQATVDVSGANGGGTALLGGDYQGKNPAIQNATATFAGSETTIRADATTNGDGGKVILWADGTTRAYGEISARGGAEGGDGGFVEVSGKQSLIFRSQVDAGAPYGLVGTLLLDPADITITGSTNDGDSDGVNTFAGSQTGTTGQVVDGSGDAGPTTIYESELEGLTGGTNVILSASNSVTTSGTFTDGVALPSGSNLSIYTTDVNGAGITLGTPFIASGTIDLSAGNGGTGSAPLTVDSLTMANGDIDLWAGGNITINGHVNASASVDAVSDGGSIALSASTGQITAGTNAVLYAPTHITLNSGSSINANNLTLKSDGMTLGGTFTIATSATLIPYTASTVIDLGGADAVATPNTLGLTSAELNTFDAGYLTIGDASNTGGLSTTANISLPTGTIDHLTLNSNGGVTINHAISLAEIGGSIQINADNGTTTPALVMGTGGSFTTTGDDSHVNSITLVSDGMDLGGGNGSLDAGSYGRVILDSYTQDLPIILGFSGTKDSDTALGLTTTDLNAASGARLTIGGVNAPSVGPISVATPVNLNSNIGTLGLISGSGITVSDTLTMDLTSGGIELHAYDSAISQAAAGVITADHLEIIDARNVDLSTATNMVNYLSGTVSPESTTAPHGSLIFKNGKDLSVSSLTNAYDATNNQTPQITLTTLNGGELYLEGPVTAENGTVTLDVAGTLHSAESGGPFLVSDKAVIKAVDGIHGGTWCGDDCVNDLSVSIAQLDAYNSGSGAFPGSFVGISSGVDMTVADLDSDNG